MSIIVIILLIIVFLHLRKKSASEKVSSGKYDGVISKFISYYDLVRQDHDALGANVIAIATYLFEIDGKVDSSSAYLAVQVQDGINDQLALSKGMEVKRLGEHMRYQYVVKAPFNQPTKIAVLKELHTKLSSLYPNDVFQLDEKIIMLVAMVDSKDMIELLSGHN